MRTLVATAVVLARVLSSQHKKALYRWLLCEAIFGSKFFDQPVLRRRSVSPGPTHPDLGLVSRPGSCEFVLASLFFLLSSALLLLFPSLLLTLVSLLTPLPSALLLFPLLFAWISLLLIFKILGQA